jgi:acyl-CoA dehydrogenase
MTDEIGTAVRELLTPLEVYRPDGSWSEPAERAACAQLASGGWLGAGLAEGLGGSGGDLPDAAAVTRACAAAGHRLPAADAGLVAGHLLGLAGLQAPAGLVLPVPVPGIIEDGQVRVQATGVPFARWAASLLIVARDGSGWRTCLVDAGAAVIRAGHNLAGEPRDAVTVDGVRPAGSARSGQHTVEQLHRAGALGRAIQIAAAIEQMLGLAVRYCRHRQQFGRSLASFQAVQQLLALLAAESLAADAAVQRALGLLGPGEWPLEPVAVAKVRAGLAADAATQLAHQLHGAIGITTEYALHRFTTPCWSWREEYGSGRHWAGALSAAYGAGVWEALTSGASGA